jgi:23S rRNA pseudouridine1911/1915/1917 synthase
MVSEHRTEEDAEGQRLDHFLVERFPDRSRAALQRWIKDGRVCVDGEVVLRPSHALRAGQTVAADPPPPRPADVEPEPIPLDVLHEDELLCVVNKPAGLTVHPGAGRHGGTLANALVHRFRTLSRAGGADRPGIVHRLDRDTSGVLVVARTEEAHHHLARQFEERTVEKLYVAIVHGVLELDSDWIELPLARDPRNRERMAVREGGREAATFYRVERRLEKHTLVRLFPRTGRTHQLRVHLLALGHPIVADPIYNRRYRPPPGATRLALHAASLAIDHPADGTRRRFAAPLPGDFLRALEGCGGGSEDPFGDILTTP